MPDEPAPPRKPRVALCIPCYDMWKAETGYDLLRLCIHSAPHIDLVPAFTRGHDTSEARNVLVEEIAAATGDLKVDAILWVDADMMFPPDALVRLLSHRLPIVGADYRNRGAPFPRIGQWVNPDDPMGSYLEIPEEAPKTGLDDNMALLGFGLILTRMHIFDDPRWQRPWFVRAWIPNARRPDNLSGFTTEDSIFCTMARALGHKIVCDLDLSAEVSHIGQFTIPWVLGGKKNG